jgi:hypothetical protein
VAAQIAVTHTHAQRRQRPPRARYRDTHIVALAQNLDNASTLENKSSAWIEATGLDGLQARMLDLAAKAATSDDAACSMNIVTNDHVCSGPGHTGRTFTSALGRRTKRRRPSRTCRLA